MGVNDYGAAASPLDAPPLGGPGGWAESVAAALNDSDETVDDRIAAHSADTTDVHGIPDTAVLGARITRPNVDDRLVEQWNGTAWSVVDYDSGVRDVSAALEAAASSKWPNTKAYIRRRGNGIDFWWYGGTGSVAGAAITVMISLPPTGWQFTNPTYSRSVVGGMISAQSGLPTPHGMYSKGDAVVVSTTAASADYLMGSVAGPTDNDIPTILLGTLVSPAPQ